jgi:hypothetical protein
MLRMRVGARADSKQTQDGTVCFPQNEVARAWTHARRPHGPVRPAQAHRVELWVRLPRRRRARRVARVLLLRALAAQVQQAAEADFELAGAGRRQLRQLGGVARHPLGLCQA